MFKNEKIATKDFNAWYVLGVALKICGKKSRPHPLSSPTSVDSPDLGLGPAIYYKLLKFELRICIWLFTFDYF